jgi:hypothetical protein
MPLLVARCPNTGREFATGIHVAAESFARLPDKLATASCPLCGYDHTLLKCDTRFVEAELPTSTKLWSPLLESAPLVESDN